MASWMEIVLRQVILYSLPVAITLTLLQLQDGEEKPQRGFDWGGFLIPMATAIAFHRAVIVALPRPGREGIRPAIMRMFMHGVLAVLGWMLFTLNLRYMGSAGTPSLWHWWIKVFMFFNLCMTVMHILPLPGMLVGECLLRMRPLASRRRPFYAHWPWLVGAIAASPLLDLLPGRLLIFPIYDQISRLAVKLAGYPEIAW